MYKLIINKSHLIFQNKSFELDDLYTLDFLTYSNSQAESFYDESYYVNELFLNIYQPWLALKFFIQNKKISLVEFNSPSYKLINLIKDLEKECDFKIINKKKSLRNIKIRIFTYFNLLITSIYLVFWMLRISTKKGFQKHSENKFIITRTKASEKKFQYFDYPKEIEDFKNKTSIYSKFSLKKRIFWIFKSFLDSLSHLKIIKKNIRKKIGKNSVEIALSYYSIRLVHTLLYEKIINSYFNQYNNQTFYTGNNLDRFSIVEEKIAKKHNFRLICIPHGLEYGFKFPKGFSGDIFFSTTKNAETYLNQMYSTEKFIFDRVIAEKMFKVKSFNKTSDRKIVFFTESREINVNINVIKELIPLLNKIGLRLCLKLHPKDNLKNYSFFDVDLIDSIEEALINNICFARKSTTLIECMYNNSKAAAILTNSKDISLFHTFPSLQNKEIHVTTNVNELFKWIKINIDRI